MNIYSLFIFLLLFCFFAGCSTKENQIQLPAWLSNSVINDSDVAAIYAKVERFNKTGELSKKFNDNGFFYYITILLLKYNNKTKIFEPLEFPISFYSNKEDFYRATLLGAVRASLAVSDPLNNTISFDQNSTSFSQDGFYLKLRITDNESINDKIHFSCVLNSKNCNISFDNLIELNETFPIWLDKNIPETKSLSTSNAAEIMEKNQPILCLECQLFDTGKINFEDWLKTNHSRCIRTKLLGFPVNKKPVEK